MAHRPPDPSDRSAGETGADRSPAGNRTLLTPDRDADPLGGAPWEPLDLPAPYPEPALPEPALPGYPAAGVPGQPALVPERARATAGDLLAEHLRAQAAEFLRALRLHQDSVGRPESARETARSVARIGATGGRIGAALHTFRALLDQGWADWLRGELGWLSGLLAGEYGHAARLERLLGALHRLSHTPERDAPGSVAAAGAVPGATDTAASAGRAPGARTGSGAARAGALLERRLTLSRTRAHSAALRGLGSSRFHAAVDAVALLASEVPLEGARAARPAAHLLPRLVGRTQHRLTEAVQALGVSGGEPGHHPAGLAHALAPDSPSASHQDAAWHRVRLLVRLRGHAQEVLHGAEDPAGPDPLSRALDRQRDAVEAAAEAAAAARTPRIAPATAYALGVLHADQRHEAEAARSAFGRLWHQAGEPVR